MSPEQRSVLRGNLEDSSIYIKGVEYPSHAQLAERVAFDCLKLTTMVLVNEVARTWVDWYDRSGRQVNTREITVDYDRPSFSERRESEDPLVRLWDAAYGEEGLMAQVFDQEAQR